MRKHTASALYTAASKSSSLNPYSPLFLLDGSHASVGLRCLTDGFRIVDKSTGFISAASDELVTTSHVPSAPFMQDSTEQVYRYFNCDLFFSPRALNLLLRALHGTNRRSRRSFFKHVLGCRRRAAKKFMEATVAKLFTLSDQFSMLKQRAVAYRMSTSIKLLNLTLYDAFVKFDFDKNGLLNAAELWGAFTFLGMSLSAMDVLDFMSSADSDRDGNLSIKELLVALEDPEKVERERRRLERSENELFGTGVNLSAPQLVQPARFGPADNSAMEVIEDESRERERRVDDMEIEEEEVSGGVFAEPPRLHRNLSSGGVSQATDSSSASAVILPRGEEELRLLQLELLRAEEEAEAADNEFENQQEKRIQQEVEVIL
jgi:hypothetical protein